jgi:hypothetical protein
MKKQTNKLNPKLLPYGNVPKPSTYNNSNLSFSSNADLVDGLDETNLGWMFMNLPRSSDVPLYGWKTYDEWKLNNNKPFISNDYSAYDAQVAKPSNITLYKRTQGKDKPVPKNWRSRRRM